MLHPHAGTMGLKGNLTEGEILEQLVHASAVSRVRNIVFMVRPVQSVHARSQSCACGSRRSGHVGRSHAADTL